MAYGWVNGDPECDRAQVTEGRGVLGAQASRGVCCYGIQDSRGSLGINAVGVIYLSD